MSTNRTTHTQRASHIETLLHLGSSGISLIHWIHSEHFRPYWFQFKLGWRIHNPTKLRLRQILTTGEPNWHLACEMAIRELLDTNRPDYRHFWKLVERDDGADAWLLEDHIVKFVVAVVEANLRDGGLWNMWNGERFEMKMTQFQVFQELSILALAAIELVVFLDLDNLCGDMPGWPWPWRWSNNLQERAQAVREDYAEAANDPSAMDTDEFIKRQAFHYRSVEALREIRRMQAGIRKPSYEKVEISGLNPADVMLTADSTGNFSSDNRVDTTSVANNTQTSPNRAINETDVHTPDSLAVTLTETITPHITITSGAGSDFNHTMNRNSLGRARTLLRSSTDMPIQPQSNRPINASQFQGDTIDGSGPWHAPRVAVDNTRASLEQADESRNRWAENHEPDRN